MFASSTAALAAPPAGDTAEAARSRCTFWLGARCYGLDTVMVGEVVPVASWVTVPGCPPAVLGLFALRGAPVALLDLGALLGLPDAPRPSPGEARPALVLRTHATLGAVAIDRMRGVASSGQGTFTPSALGSDHPAVQGLLALPGNGGDVVTVLRAELLLARLKELRFR